MYSAAQNLLVAARALGLGAAFTMLHTLAEPAIRQLLAIPDEITIAVTMPVGRPSRSGPSSASRSRRSCTAIGGKPRA